MTAPSIDDHDRALQALAAVAAALVEPYDVVGTLTRLLADCAATVGAASGGLVVRVEGEELELLAVTSHRAQEIELYQLQSAQGPCYEAAHTGEPCSAATRIQIDSRWPVLRDPFADAGYQSVQATPLRWHGQPIGAFNMFWSTEGEHLEVGRLTQSFADMCTLAIVHSGRMSPNLVLERTRTALDARGVIELAKGVVADQLGLPVDEAFWTLLQFAADRRQLLSVAARSIIDAAADGSAIVPRP